MCLNCFAYSLVLNLLIFLDFASLKQVGSAKYLGVGQNNIYFQSWQAHIDYILDNFFLLFIN